MYSNDHPSSSAKLRRSGTNSDIASHKPPAAPGRKRARAAPTELGATSGMCGYNHDAPSGAFRIPTTTPPLPERCVSGTGQSSGGWIGERRRRLQNNTKPRSNEKAVSRPLDPLATALQDAGALTRVWLFIESTGVWPAERMSRHGRPKISV